MTLHIRTPMHTGPVGCQYVLDQNWFWLPIRVSAEKVTEKK